MAAFQNRLNQLDQLDIAVIAATSEDRVSTELMATENGIRFPIAYGLHAKELEDFVPRWDTNQHGCFVEPMEFIVSRGGTILGSVYASGPLGRLHVEEVLIFVRNRAQRRFRGI